MIMKRTKLKKMSGQRNQRVRSPAKSVIINMNPVVVLRKLTGPQVERLQRPPEIVDTEQNFKIEVVEFEEANYECPFCDRAGFSRMNLLVVHVTGFHKISKNNTKSVDIAMILRLLSMSVTPQTKPMNFDQSLAGRGNIFMIFYDL
jgi:hypothetical protein